LISKHDDGATDFRSLAENSADVICRVGPDLAFVYLSGSVFDVLGWTPEELIGKSPPFLVVAEDLPVLAASHADTLTQSAQRRPISLRMRKKDGSIVWMEVSARLVNEPGSSGRHTVIVMRDVSERKAHEQELAELALTDGLTGLANRRSFDETIRREWLRTLDEASAISLMLLDLDHFEEFNDRYGQETGDDCLRAASGAIRTTIRATDTACRYAEELAVILPATEAGEAARVAEAVRLAIERLGLPPGANAETGHRLTASIGVSTALARHGGTVRMPEALVMAADDALYKAKHGGRNRVATTPLFTPKRG
jgi:diguanylate cyclase (GGDEF)-like protein/PAS domain S-box-containing protein